MRESGHGPPNADAEIEQLTSRVLAVWRRRLRRRKSDELPRSGDRGENERLLIAALLRASNASDDTALPGLASVAARYGAGERRTRFDPGGLCDELAVLRQIVWKEVRASDPSVQSAVDRILRFDRALSIVVKAAVTAGSTSPSSDVGCLQPDKESRNG